MTKIRNITLCAALLALPLLPAHAQQKYALVIGNGAYTGISKLNNPVNDAKDMSAVLKDLGFTVDLVLNGDLDKMEDAVFRMKNRLSAAKDAYGFFFYAGHGVQSNGENYLIPVDANIRSESQLRPRAMSVQFMMEELNQAGNALNVVVLDACRDNPFAWGRSGSRGLQVVARQPADSIIVFATTAGAIAADGTGRNGLFTGELLKNLRTPGLEVTEVFRRTMGDVVKASGSTQRPAVYNQFPGTAYLGKPATAQGGAPAKQAPQWGEEVVDTGAITVSTVTAGTVQILRGSENVGIRQLKAGARISLSSLTVGMYTLRMTYTGNQTEEKRVEVKRNGTSGAAFTWQPAAAAASSVAAKPPATKSSYKIGDTGPAGGTVFFVNGQRMEAAPASSEFKANWDDAVERCKLLNVKGIGGWHLPTKDELDAIYQQLHKQGLGRFSNGWYWSSSEKVGHDVWSQYFGNGTTGVNYRTSGGYAVRAVRVFEDASAAESVKKQYAPKSFFTTGDTGPAGGTVFFVNGQRMEAAPISTEFVAKWDDAVERCKSLNIKGIGGWHLPTKDELNTMYTQLKKTSLSIFTNSWYWSSSEWSSSEHNGEYAWLQSFDYDSQDFYFKYYEYSVRAVRKF